MSSSPIKYRSFTKILLCCNIPALSASSLQKKRRNKVILKHRTLMKRLWKEEESNCLTLISIETKTIYIVSVFNCMEYIIVDCMLELVIHHFSLQLKTIILKINNSGTCLIRHTKGPEKCVGLYRVLENSGFLFS